MKASDNQITLSQKVRNVAEKILTITKDSKQHSNM